MHGGLFQHDPCLILSAKSGTKRCVHRLVYPSGRLPPRPLCLPGQILNSLGYGKPSTGLQLDLVYNPGGAFLAPPQAKLEPAYRTVRSAVRSLV